MELADITPTILELLVQDGFSQSSGRSAANALYGGTARDYARSIAVYPTRTEPILFLDSSTALWLDENGDIQSKGSPYDSGGYRSVLEAIQ